jgi:hypothetical protein
MTTGGHLHTFFSAKAYYGLITLNFRLIPAPFPICTILSLLRLIFWQPTVHSLRGAALLLCWLSFFTIILGDCAMKFFSFFRILLVWCVMLGSVVSGLAQTTPPVITSFAPTLGPFATIVTLNLSNVQPIFNQSTPGMGGIDILYVITPGDTVYFATTWRF